MKVSDFTTFDNSKIALYKWEEAMEPKAVLQIAHGTMEHAQRYAPFAEYLNSQGILVVAPDLRAFGKTADSLEENGQYKGDWYGDCLRDQLAIASYCRKTYPNLPLLFFGHSAGSLIGQLLVQEPALPFRAVIFSGSSYMKNPLYSIVQGFVRFQSFLMGWRKKAIWLDKVIFGTYDKPYKTEGKNAWLSRDKEEVRKYNEDPYCGIPASYGYYESFLGFNRLYKKEGLETINKSMPLVLLSGENDQMNGGTGKGVRKLLKMYRSLDLTNVSMKLYPRARHEILNEQIKQEVYEDIRDFIQSVLDSKRKA